MRERLLHRLLNFTGSESDVRHSGGVRGGPLSGDFWSRIRWWKGVAEEITGSRCQPARAPVGGERTTVFTGSESDVRHSGAVRGGPLSGDFWSRIRWWKGVAKEITAAQPAFTGSKSDVRHSGGVRGGSLSGDFWSRIGWWKGVAKQIARSQLEGGYEFGVAGTKCWESWEGVSRPVYVGYRERRGRVGSLDVPRGAGARPAIGLRVLYSESSGRFRREHNHRTGGTGVGARAAANEALRNPELVAADRTMVDSASAHGTSSFLRAERANIMVNSRCRNLGCAGGVCWRLRLAFLLCPLRSLSVSRRNLGPCLRHQPPATLELGPAVPCVGGERRQGSMVDTVLCGAGAEAR